MYPQGNRSLNLGNGWVLVSHEFIKKNYRKADRRAIKRLSNEGFLNVTKYDELRHKSREFKISESIFAGLVGSFHKDVVRGLNMFRDITPETSIQMKNNDLYDKNRNCISKLALEASNLIGVKAYYESIFNS